MARAFSGLQPNTPYTFKAKARNQNGTVTGESVTVATYTLAAVALPAGGQPFAGVYQTSATVAWSSGTGTAFNGPGASYMVVASTSPDYLGTNVSSYTYSVSSATLDLNPNTSYYFRIQAYNAGHMTDYSWLVLGSTVTLVNPPVALPVQAITTHSVTAAWDANGNPGDTLYTAQVAEDNTFSPVFASTLTTAVSFEFAGLPVANTYYFLRVNAVNRAGSPTPWTALGSTVTAIEMPESVAFTYISSDTIHTQFSAAGGFTDLNEELSGLNQAMGGGWQGWEAVTTHEYTGLVPNAPYYVKAKARNRLGVETDTTVEFGTHTLATVSLPQAGELFPAVYLASATVAWSSGTAAAGFNYPGATYELQASTAADFSGVVVSSVTPALGAALELERNTSYYFRALAYNVDNVTDHNWLVLGSTATEIETPTDITFTAVNDTSIEVLVQGQGGFSNLSSGLSSIAKSLNGAYNAWFNSSADTFTGLTPNTLYAFGAKARNLEGRVTPEIARSTWTLAVTPGPSGQPFAGISASSFTMAWSPATNPAGTTYYAQISLASDFSAVFASSLTVNEAALFVDLLANTTYYGRVAALNGAGIYSAFADLGNVVTRMEAPTGVYADGVTTTTIVMSAYAPGAAFTAMERGDSAVNIAKDGAYGVWGSSGNYWSGRAPLASNTGSAAAAALGGKLYVLGGWVGGAPFDYNREYDPALNTWTTKAPMLTARYALGAAAIGGKLYAVGGRSGPTYYAANEEYDPETNTWSTKAPMPTARCAFAAGAVSGKLYAAGGFSGAVLSVNEEYDPAYDRWSSRTGLPAPRSDMAGAVVADRLYAVAGYDGGTTLGLNEEYDPAGDAWATKAPLPAQTYMLGGASAGGKVYAVGGYSAGYLDQVSEYDPSADTWTARAPLPAGRSALAAAGVGGRIYVAGGNSGGYINSVMAYEPGVARAFSGLQPNMPYAFKAKARNQEGVETGESVEITTYTLAAVALPESGEPFAQVWASSVTVIYSSGSAASGYNGPGALYQVEASTAADYTGGTHLGAMYNPDDLFREVIDLASNTTYHFRIMAYNAGNMTDNSWLPLGTTVTHAITPNAAAQPFDGVNHEGITIQWGRNGNSEGTAYRLQVSSYSNFSGVYSEIFPLYVSTTAIGGLTPNTSWYARVAAVSYSGVQTQFYLIGSTITRMPQPAEILFPAVSTMAITAEAWSSYGFPNLTEGLSGVRIRLDGGGALWSQSALYGFSGLLPNRGYGFTAAARNQTGIETAESPEVSTYTLATVSLRQQGPVFSGVWLTSVTVNWSSGTVADGFNGPGADHHISVARDEAFTQIVNGAATYNLFWSPDGLWPNTTHYFKARAVNNALVANPDWLTLGSTSTLANAVSAASVYEVWPTTVTVDWAALPLVPSSDTCEGYLVQASTAPDFTGVIRSSATGDNALGSLVVLNLFAETTYYFRVGALNHNGVPNYALAGSTWTPSENIPPTITDNELATDYTWYGALPVRTYNIDFHDTGGSALENFQIKATTGPNQSGTVNADWTDILTGIDADDYTADWNLTLGAWNLLAEGTNYISVQVFDGSGNNDALDDAFVVFKDTTPPAISANYDDVVWRSTYGFTLPLGFTDGHSRLDTAQGTIWSAPGLAGSQLQGWENIIAGADVPVYAVDLPMGETGWNLLADGTNYFSLRAWDYAVPVNTNTWVDAFVILKDTTPPAAAAGLFVVDLTTYSAAVTFAAPFETPSRLDQFAVQYASYTVAWATSAVAGSTHVYVSTGGATAGEDQYIPVADLGPNTTYYYVAWSRDLAGNWSGISPVAAVPTLAMVPVPVGGPQIHVTSAAFAWAPVDSGGYTLYASTASDFTGTQLSSATPLGAASALTVTGLAPNTLYYFRHAALNWSGAPNYAVPVAAYTLPIIPSSATVYAAVSSVTVMVEWLSNGNGPETQYQVRVSSDELSILDSTMTLPSGAEPYGYTFEGLLPNTTYWFEVRAYGNGGNFSEMLVLGSTVTTPVPPVLTGYTLWATSAAVAWGSNGNSAGTLYQADLSTAADFTGALLSSVTGSEFTFTMGAITPNTTYYLRLRAVSEATGMASLYVYSDGLTLAAAPDAVGAWTQGPNNIGVYWDAPSNPGVTGYGAFSAGTGLPAAVYGHAGAIAGDWAFLTGGYNGTAYRSEVWSAPLSAEGALGAWTQVRSLPAARYAHSAVALRGRLYIIGGYDGSAARAEVWSAPISSSGALGEWVAEAPLPQAAYAHAFTAGENTLYVLGGYSGGPVSNVWYTSAGSDGTLAAWNPGPALPEAAYSLAAGMSGAYLYITGGYDGVNPKSGVWRAAVGADGSLAAWTADTALPSGVHAHALEVLPGALIVSGGNGGTLARSATLLGALNADGSIAGWTAGAALPAARQSHIMFSRGSRLAVLGGYDGASAKTDGYYSALAGTEYRLAITGGASAYTPWQAGGWLDVGSLTPNTQYTFAPVARNYAGTEAPGAVTYSTFTYAAQPSSAPISGVFISSAQANWLPADNPAGTRYEAQLSSDAAHTQLAFTSVTANSYAAFEDLADSYAYHARVRALNDIGVATAWTALGSTTTRANPALDFTSPTVTSNMTGEPAWLNHGNTLYDIDFADAGGAWLSAFEVGVSTTPADPLPAWTAVLAGMNTEGYTADWALPAGLFDLLGPGTSYISVRAWDGNGNSTTTVDAFYVLKDTSPPVITDLQTGEDAWRMDDAGAVYNVDFADEVSGLAAIEYSASSNQGTGDAAGLAWRPIVSVSTWLKAFTAGWAVDFAALPNDATSFISVRARDLAGNTVAVPGIDVFKILKYVSGPEVDFTAPDAAYHSALPLIAGTADDARSHAASAVEVSVLEEATGKYWDGAGFLASSRKWLVASGTGSWSYTHGIAWLENYAYQVVARSSDSVGNYSLNYATRSFTYDSLAPVIAPLSPADGATVNSAFSISGTAFDAAGYAGMAIKVKAVDSGYWWDFGASTWSVAGSSAAVTPAAGWAYTLPALLAASIADGASYYYTLYAVDSSSPARATDFHVYGATFAFVDDTPPAAVATLQASTGSAPGNIQLNWTAPGDDGAAGMILYGQYRVQYSTAADIVFSTAAAQIAEDFTAVAAGAARAKELTGLTPGAEYFLRLWTRDDAYNWSALSNAATAQAAPFPDRVGGHVLTVSSAGITGVLVEAFDNTGLLQGSAYTLNDGSGTYVIPGLSAGPFRVQATWEAEDLISSVGTDGIALGASAVDFTLSIAYDLASIGGELAGYRLSARGYNTQGIRPAAASVGLYQRGRLVASAPVDSNGRFSFGNLLPGKYTLKVPNPEGGTKELNVRVKPGEALIISPLGELLKTDKVYVYPNPASRTATFHIESDQFPLRVQLAVFDITGRLIAKLANEAFVSRNGGLEADWEIPAGVASGVYIYSLHVKNEGSGEHKKLTRKFAIVK